MILITTDRNNGYIIQVFAYKSKSVKNDVHFTDEDGKVHVGPFRFANRITARNGRIIHDQQEFNTIQAARKNLKALYKALEG